MNDKEEWILCAGIWFGIGASILAFGITLLIETPIKENTEYYMMALGIIFIFFGIYSHKKYLIS